MRGIHAFHVLLSPPLEPLISVQNGLIQVVAVYEFIIPGRRKIACLKVRQDRKRIALIDERENRFVRCLLALEVREEHEHSSRGGERPRPKAVFLKLVEQ